MEPGEGHDLLDEGVRALAIAFLRTYAHDHRAEARDWQYLCIYSCV